MKMNFMPSKDSDGKCLMHSKSDNKEARLVLIPMKSLKNFFIHFCKAFK